MRKKIKSAHMHEDFSTIMTSRSNWNKSLITSPNAPLNDKTTTESAESVEKKALRARKVGGKRLKDRIQCFPPPATCKKSSYIF